MSWKPCQGHTEGPLCVAAEGNLSLTTVSLRSGRRYSPCPGWTGIGPLTNSRGRLMGISFPGGWKSSHPNHVICCDHRQSGIWVPRHWQRDGEKSVLNHLHSATTGRERQGQPCVKYGSKFLHPFMSTNSGAHTQPYGFSQEGSNSFAPI